MRQNPHVRICGGPGSATTLVYPTLVQVKAIAGPSWQFDIRTFVDVRCQAGAQTMGQPTPPPAGDLICVFVRLHTDGADRFYVLRWPELQRVLINGYRGYLERHGGRRPKRGRLLPHGAPGNAHRALPGQLVALRRVHGRERARTAGRGQVR